MVPGEVTTVWTQVRRAVEGSEEDRNALALRYLPLVRDYLRRRWEGWWLAGSVDDAAQDVFVECFRSAGVLARAQPGHGLRGLLVATSRNVARRYEEDAARRRDRTPAETTFLRAQPAREDALTAFFDRRWAESMMADATRRMEQLAGQGDEQARRRFELLRLRFEEGLPIRAIAARWGLEPRQVHDAYARARREFHRCLREVVAEHIGAPHADLDRECQELLDLLG